MQAIKGARLAYCGSPLVVGAVLLLAARPSSSIGAFVLAFGIGMGTTVRPIARTPRVHVAALAATGVGFVAYRLGVLAADGLSAIGALVLVSEALALACVFALVYEHAHGIARVAALFHHERSGYVPVLDEEAAAQAVEAELARSRRHGTPLTFLLLEPSEHGRVPDFEVTMSRVSRAAQAELVRAYVREQACELIAEQVRRSDIVVCAEDRFLVMSAVTDTEGTEMLAARMLGAAKYRLGLQLRTGVASFPNHGTTYEELVAVAMASASDGDDEPHDDAVAAPPVVSVTPADIERAGSNRPAQAAP
jgi:hypothetical protein